MEQIKSSTVIVEKNSGSLGRLEADLKKQSIEFAKKTDLTAKADSVETINKEHTLIDQYKEILKREITNITNIGEGFNQLDAKYARRR